RLLVGGHAALGQDARVHLGVQGLDPAVEDLREAGHVGDAGDLQAFLAELLRGAAGGDDLEAARAEAARQLDDALLAVDGDDGAPCHCCSLVAVWGTRPAPGIGGASLGWTGSGLGMRVRSPRASRHTASQVAAMAVTAREYDREATPNTGDR